MNVLIVGGGKVGSYLAQSLIADGHKVSVIEKNPTTYAKLQKELDPDFIFKADGCDPLKLEESGVRNTDLVVAVTGDDEDNLVVSQLAKNSYKVPLVIARVNNPRNQWLFDRQWGVDVAVSAVHIIAKVIQEEASLGDIVTLLKLKKGEMSIIEMSMPSTAKSINKMIKDINVPSDSVLVAIVRGEQTIIPSGDTRIESNDKILALTSVASERALKNCLGI